jgi:hypothetical protein
MQELLRQHNLDLLRDLERLGETLQQPNLYIPAELKTFYTWTIQYCAQLQQQVSQNLKDLDIGLDDILTDILSNTHVATRSLQVFNRFFLSPVLRARQSDSLCLRILSWLHHEHPQTKKLSIAMADGGFASWSYPEWPTIYFMPPSYQRRLLYMSLFFHEFGHVLYACHKEEMDLLALELQKEISRLLEPNAIRGDAYSQLQEVRRTEIVETWFEWTQEIFCDAVGLIIGGPAFAHSFSFYFRMLGKDEFTIRREELIGSTHPVTWLRIRLLADRLRRMGFEDIAKNIELSWNKVADLLKLKEDYFGFYELEFLPIVQEKIEDMLLEANPRQFHEQELSCLNEEVNGVTPVQLVNQAWSNFIADSEGYGAWEIGAINAWMNFSDDNVSSGL